MPPFAHGTHTRFASEVPSDLHSSPEQGQEAQENIDLMAETDPFQRDTVHQSAVGSPENQNRRISAEIFANRAQNVVNVMQDAIDGLSALLISTNDEIQQKELELKQAREQIQSLENALTDCTKRLLKTSPDSLLDDAQLQKEYSTLRGSVEDWVWHLPSTTLTAKCLNDLSRQVPWLRNTTARQGPLMLLQTLPDVQLEVLGALVFRQMWYNLFIPWFIGASESEQKFMKTLERNMKRTKDREYIDVWRSNTIRAHAQGINYNENVDRDCHDVALNICSILGHFDFSETANLDKLLYKFKSRIATMAAELATKIRCTPESYIWEWYDNNDWARFKELRNSDFQRYSMIDSHRHNELRADKFSSFPSNYKIAKALLVIFPAIFRYNREDDRYLMVEKATLLVKLDEQVSAELDCQRQLQREMDSRKPQYDAMDEDCAVSTPVKQEH